MCHCQRPCCSILSKHFLRPGSSLNSVCPGLSLSPLLSLDIPAQLVEFRSPVAQSASTEPLGCSRRITVVPLNLLWTLSFLTVPQTLPFLPNSPTLTSLFLSRFPSCFKCLPKLPRQGEGRKYSYWGTWFASAPALGVGGANFQHCSSPFADSPGTSWDFSPTPCPPWPSQSYTLWPGCPLWLMHFSPIISVHWLGS